MDKVRKNIKIRNRYTMLHGIAQFNVWALSLGINIADRPLSISTARSSFSHAAGDVSFERSVQFSVILVRSEL